MKGTEDLMRAGNRFEVLTRIEKGLLKVVEAAQILGVTPRQTRRLRRKMEHWGLKGLFYRRDHGAPNKIPDKELDEILKLRRGLYRTFNVLHFRDILKMRHGIERSREFYRRLFILHKLANPQRQRKRKPKHRIRFEMPQAGMLIQRDTSIHLWIPGADKSWKLILDLDDHSRKITGAFFSEKDDVLSNMLVTWETLSTHGLPLAYYTDNNPIFNPLNKKPKQGMYHFYQVRSGEEKETLSQFKRALQELGIQCIHATPYQPQGKGKIERIFRFMQDRLVKEMTAEKVTTIHEANKYLRKWVRWYNNHHLHSETKMIPQERLLKNNAFRKLPQDLDLDQVLCLKYQRHVKADNTFDLHGETYQLRANEYRLSYAKTHVEIRIYMNQKMKVFFKKQPVGCVRYQKPNTPERTFFRCTQEDILALR